MHHIVLIMWVWCYSTVYYCAGEAVVSVGSNSGIYSSVVDSITSCSDFLPLYFCTLNTTDSYPCIYPDYYLVVECSRRELSYYVYCTIHYFMIIFNVHICVIIVMDGMYVHLLFK